MPPVPRPSVTVPPAKPPVVLKIPQARVLKALLPDNPKYGYWEWPSYSRATLASHSGFNPTTGTINRVLNGIPPGSSSGAPHPGLIELGLMVTFEIDVSGIKETQYRITEAGIAAITAWLAANTIPDTRDKTKCTNDRYHEEKSAESA